VRVLTLMMMNGLPYSSKAKLIASNETRPEAGLFP